MRHENIIIDRDNRNLTITAVVNVHTYLINIGKNQN